jgi:class 3 adenylate cyclase
VQRFQRKNAGLLTWVRAAMFGVTTLIALLAMHFKPAVGAAGLALAAAVLGYFAPELGVLVSIIAIAIPMSAANPVVGILFLVLGVVSMRYLAADGARVHILMASAVIGAFVGPIWAIPAIAGVLLGAGDGAVVSAVAVATIELLGLSLGLSHIGVITTGGSGSHVLMSFSAMPASLFSAQWIAGSFGSLGASTVDKLIGTVSAMKQPLAMAAQPVAFGLSAAVAGYLARRKGAAKKMGLTLAAVAAGVVVLPIATAVLGSLGAGSPDWGRVTIVAVASFVVAAAVVATWDKVFTLIPIAATGGAASGIATEDADVDELLRLIATAEDKLASQHTTNKVVMITDMKAFSRMTEEDGSMMTAKAIQRHRDLLLPLIEKNNGKGKSTGGDGLVAAFDGAADAIKAAAQMQRALTDSNAAHPNEREMWVRIGIASGEVVLDKSGRPFIGGALNLAARVMDLADGGQAFATAAVAAAAPDARVRTFSFGEFQLKNIARPEEVFELLWAEGQEPREPRARTAAQ